MANLVVTSTTNAVKVVFNDLSTAAGMDKGTWAKGTIEHCMLVDDLVSVEALDAVRWTLSHNSNALGMIVDSVDGASPSSASDLYDKISALIE